MSHPTATVPAAHLSRRIRVQVRADACLYEGYVHLHEEAHRLQEVLNDPRPFLNLTEVVMQDGSGGQAFEATYVALNKGAITHVVILGDEAVAASAGGRPKGKQPRKGASASDVSVPPAGPKTRPVGRASTQASSDVDEMSVSDLILEDEPDDIDPDDLLGG
ncbi:MAG: hypothetical protein CL928_03920 [Deltaproteobacteria bacterium]|nr:hypothetical protein [Deltaproteobacteria bacterium]